MVRLGAITHDDPRSMVGESDWYLSEVIGAPVFADSGASIGHLKDIVIACDDAAKAPVVALMVRTGRQTRRVPIPQVAQFSPARISITANTADLSPFERGDGELLAYQDVLDAEIIDRRAVRVVRANDAILAGDGLAVRGIDASAPGVARRLVPRALGRHFAGTLLPWDQLEPMVDAPPGIDLRLSHAALAELHPSDIAKLMDHLPYRQGARILCSLDDTLAAATLEEVEKHRQAEILEYMSEDRAIAVLNIMAPDAAADLLQEVPRDASDAMISRLEPEVSADIKLLLSYPRHSAAGLMTTEFVMALENETVGAALDHIRPQLSKPHLVYYVYVVDNAEDRRLKGVVSLRDILLAKPDQPLASCMGGGVRAIHPNEHAKEVARVMGEYNLLAMPVVDDDGSMLGLVTADDVLDLMLPETMRQHLPRLFS